MATATIPQTAKGAVRFAKGKVHSFFFDHDGDESIPVEVLQRQYKRYEADLKVTRYTLDNLLPIEKSEKYALTQRAGDIEQLLKAVEPRAHRYPILSAEPLGWRDAKGYPRLVIMPLAREGKVTIAAKREYHQDSARWWYDPISNDGTYSEFTTNIIDRYYPDVGKRLKEDCPDRGEVSISMKLGKLLIPPKTREKIRKAVPVFGNQLFLIAEATEWHKNKVVYPDPDPLIVGYQDGLLFLVDAFDLTPIEKMIAAEFTVPQQALGL